MGCGGSILNSILYCFHCISFELYLGLAHLEALEMLSNQSEMKIQSALEVMSGEILSVVQTELEEIKDAFQLEDLESDEIGRNQRSRGENIVAVLCCTLMCNIYICTPARSFKCYTSCHIKKKPCILVSHSCSCTMFVMVIVESLADCLPHTCIVSSW